MQRKLVFKGLRFSILSVFFLSIFAFNEIEKPEKKPMNILFILADDLRWNSLHCTGTNFLITPNIDQLAAQGITFVNACVTTPICCCSRASILTGQFISRNGVQNFSTQIATQNFANTYPGVLRNAGYYTGFVGKYGVGKVRKTDFDFSAVYEGKHWYPVHPELQMPKSDNNGKSKHNIPIIGDSIHVTDRNANDAIKFLKDRPKGKPFNLSVSFFAPHAEDFHPDQYRYKPSSEKYYQDISIPVSESATQEALNALPPFISNEKNGARIRWHWRFDTPEKYQKYMKAYYRLVTDMDAAVGRIIEELKAEGEYENTLIIFMGDNGYFQSDHQLADKWYPYEESIRVPLIIYDPRLPATSRGKLNSEFALNIDIAPTILAAAGAPKPNVIQGQDLAPLYFSEKKNLPWRKDFFVEHPVIENADFIPSSEAVVTHSEKYINWPNNNYEEYFNLKKDVNELHNGFKEPKNKQKIAALKMRLEVLKAAAK